MLRQLYDYAKSLLLIKEQTEKNAADIREVRQELKELTAAVQRLAYEIRRVHENEGHEREKMALRLENAMLRFERRLSSGSREADEEAD
jgi:hypothetical protein